MFPEQFMLPWIVLVWISLPSVSTTVLLLKLNEPLTVFRKKPCQNPL